MRGKHGRLDIDPVGEAALHHQPADRALRAAEQEQHDQPERIAARHGALRQEPQQWQRESDADQPAEQAVEIFPEIDVLERGERHALVHQHILRAVLIGIELGLPVGGAERRQRAGHRLPLGDRQARLGEPRDAADRHHQQNQPGNAEQPGRERARLGGYNIRRMACSGLALRRLDHGRIPCSGRRADASPAGRERGRGRAPKPKYEYLNVMLYLDLDGTK